MTTSRTTKMPSLAQCLARILIIGPLVWQSNGSLCRADDGGGKTYAVKLAFPTHVGDKYDISCDGTQDLRNEITVGANKPIVQNQNLAVHLDGKNEVLAVDSKGNATKLTCIIKKFVHADARESEILPPGAIVTATSAANPAGGPNTQYSLKDGNLTPEQSAALAIVITVHAPESATDDEIFGTDKSQKIGGIWSINAAKAAADLGKDGLTIQPADLTGDVTLADTQKVNGVDFLKVKAHITAKDMKAPLPNGVTIAPGAKMDMRMDGLFSPTDGPVASTLDMSMEFRATGAAPDGSAIAMHMTMKAHKVDQLTNIKH